MGIVGALVVAAASVATGSWLWRHFRSVSRGDWRPAQGAQTPWWSPGQGGHGGDGGQSPPIVPYNPDWDVKNRIS